MKQPTSKCKMETNTQTYPLILWQRVVDPQVLLACSLARVSDMLRQKNARISEHSSFVCMYDHIVTLLSFSVEE